MVKRETLILQGFISCSLETALRMCCQVYAGDNMSHLLRSRKELWQL